MAQWIRRRSTEPKIAGSIPAGIDIIISNQVITFLFGYLAISFVFNGGSQPHCNEEETLFFFCTSADLSLRNDAYQEYSCLNHVK